MLFGRELGLDFIDWNFVLLLLVPSLRPMTTLSFCRFRFCDVIIGFLIWLHEWYISLTWIETCFRQSGFNWRVREFRLIENFMLHRFVAGMTDEIPVVPVP